jgi:phosphonoacetate hydrolase
LVHVNGRDYRSPDHPVVVVCLDGSCLDYISKAAAAGDAPFLASLIARGQLRMADAAMPTFTNPNNVSIVTGVPPSQHGISGNFFLDRDTSKAVLMNDPSFLRAPTILDAFSQTGAHVVAITAKDKLRPLLAAGLLGICESAEQAGVPIYSAALSEHVLRRGVQFMRSRPPDLMYLSTSDFVQHAHPPGSTVANTFYRVIDEQLAMLDDLGATLVITADHGMESKADAAGRPRIIYLQDLCDAWTRCGAVQVILPITDPYVAHHGSLGSFAVAYVEDGADRATAMRRLSAVAGIDGVFEREDACSRFELPSDRTGDLAVLADRDHVVGTRPADHDLSALHGPLRSHGGRAEQRVPVLFNRPILRDESRPLRNFDAFWMALNAL